MKKELVINSTEYETRVAILEDDHIVELQTERAGADRMVGDIYKGRIASVLPGMQAAFVDIGMERAAYLHSSDIGKVYHDGYTSDEYDEEEAPAAIVRKTRRAGIETVLKKGQEILVQVIKEPISTKGPRIASEISLAGRYVVMVPDDDHVRISKRITNWAEKRRLKFTFESACRHCHHVLTPPGMPMGGLIAHRAYLIGETTKKCADCHPHVGHKDMIETANRFFKKS